MFRPHPSGAASPLRAFAHRPFTLLWAARTISQFGDSLHFIALAWWVLEETGSAATMGTVLIFSSVPRLHFLLIGGVAVDRFSRLNLMLASDLLRGVSVGLVALLISLDALALLHLLALSALFGTVGAFFSPAFTAAIPDLVPEDALPSANSLRSLGSQLAGILGPVTAGLIVAGGGVSLALALDAASFLVSALCVVGVARIPSLHQRVESTSSMVRDLREGIGTVAGSPWLWITITVAGVSNFTLVGPVATSLPLLIDEHFGAGVGAFALFQSVAAAGAFVAALWLGRFTVLRRRGLLTYGAWLIDALMLLSLGLPVPLYVGAAAMFVFGAAETMLGLVWMSTLQEPSIVARERLGRVASIDEFGSDALAPLGFALAGIAADSFGPSPVFVVGGLVGAAVISLGLLHPAVRTLD